MLECELSERGLNPLKVEVITIATNHLALTIPRFAHGIYRSL